MINETHLAPVLHASVGHRRVILTAPHTGPVEPAGRPAQQVGRASARAAVRQRKREVRRGAPFLRSLTTTKASSR